VWTEPTSITIGARDMEAFFFTSNKLEGVNKADPMSLVGGTVFSTYGPVTNIDVSTSAAEKDKGGTSVNIWVSDDSTTAGSMANGQLDTTNLVPNLSNKCSGATFDVNFVLSNSSNHDNGQVDDGTIAINIPPGFIVNSVTDQDGDFSASLDTPVSYSDGSQQLTGTFTNLGGATAEAMIATVNLTAPTVTVDVIYIFTVVADGFIDSNQPGPDPPIGPLLEFPIQVIDVNNPGSCT